ncbi:MAG: CARDB domain-containing protein [bacterium]|nr:CARDB domain-containing protein [bacterium]
MRNGKKIVAWLLCLMLLSGVLSGTALADFSYSDEDSMVVVKQVPVGRIGKKMSVKFSIYNNTSDDMSDTVVTLAVPNEDEYSEEDDDGDVIEFANYPFEMTEDLFKETKNLGTIKMGKSKSVTLHGVVRRDMTQGYYKVPIKVEYGSSTVYDYVTIWLTNSDSETTTESEESNVDYAFTLGEGQETPHGLYTDVLNFGVNLHNVGVKKAYDVRLELNLENATDINQFPLELEKPNYDEIVGDMEPDEMTYIPYSMDVRDEAKTGYYILKFKIRYREEADGNFAEPIEKNFYIRITGEDEETSESKEWNKNTSKMARIVVDGYQTIPEKIIAGDSFELRIRMKNASTDISASNILFTLEPEKAGESGGAAFTSESGSTSIVVNSLAGGQTTELVFQMQSKPSLEQKAYTMKIQEQYDSPDYMNAEEEVSIDIPVYQVAKLNTGTVEVMPSSINVGEESNIMFSINNTGKVDLYNVMVTFAAESIQQTDTYVGNIKPGSTGNVDVMVSGTAATMDDGKVQILITYEDENGSQSTVEKEMELFVTEQQDFSGMDDMETGNIDEIPAEPSFFQKYKLYLAGAAAVLVLVVVVAILRIRKKRKAAGEEGMDDEIS